VAESGPFESREENGMGAEKARRTFIYLVLGPGSRDSSHRARGKGGALANPVLIGSDIVIAALLASGKGLPEYCACGEGARRGRTTSVLTRRVTQVEKC
jgi:hypothetical protein